MTRLERKNRKDIIFVSQGGILGSLDNSLKEFWRINDEEYDYICEKITDTYCPLLIEERASISIIKNNIKEVNTLLEQFYKEKNEMDF